MKNSFKILNHDIELVIFDMDGTLIDSTSIWHKIDEDFFAKRGIYKVPKEYADDIVHMGLQQGAQMTIDRYGFKDDTVEGIIKEWQDASFHQYAEIIPLKEGAIELLEYYKSKGVILALATANAKPLYEPCLKRLKIDKYFDYIIDVDIVRIGKSSPKIFDHIIDKYGVKRENAMVLEDSIVGIQTAYKAGYLTISVYDESTEKLEAEKIKHSHRYIRSLKELLEL